MKIEFDFELAAMAFMASIAICIMGGGIITLIIAMFVLFGTIAIWGLVAFAVVYYITYKKLAE